MLGMFGFLQDCCHYSSVDCPFMQKWSIFKWCLGYCFALYALDISSGFLDCQRRLSNYVTGRRATWQPRDNVCPTSSSASFSILIIHHTQNKVHALSLDGLRLEPWLGFPPFISGRHGFTWYKHDLGINLILSFDTWAQVPDNQLTFISLTIVSLTLMQVNGLVAFWTFSLGITRIWQQIAVIWRWWK